MQERAAERDPVLSWESGMGYESLEEGEKEVEEEKEEEEGGGEEGGGGGGEVLQARRSREGSGHIF